jgi:predicted nucleic acid-binding protein
MSGSFFDSNVILYLAASDNRKSLRAEQLLGAGGAISVQVLNESANVLRRKRRLPWKNVLAFLSELRAGLKVHPVTTDTHEMGLRLGERYGFAIYDSMIVAAALQADCDTLWSEDMQDGLVVEQRLRIANPFGGTPPPP